MGITAVILLLGSFGYIISDKTYFSGSRGIVMECARFSESGTRCYPDLLTTKGYRD